MAEYGRALRSYGADALRFRLRMSWRVSIVLWSTCTWASLEEMPGNWTTPAILIIRWSKLYWPHRCCGQSMQKVVDSHKNMLWHPALHGDVLRSAQGKHEEVWSTKRVSHSKR